MQFDASLPPCPLMNVPEIARKAEEIGFKCLWVPETQHDPFLPGGLIAEHTQSMNFGTAVAIAFARSPANLAYISWDLAQASNGRFILGLGTQVKAHIERRFGMEWPKSPMDKLREQISAIRTFWHTWQMGNPLKFRGEYFRLSLMSPFFNPGPIHNPDIPIYIAGVNPGMARLAGEVADGFQVHPLHSQRYLQEVLVPAIEKGQQNSGRSQHEVKISIQALTATNHEERAFVRTQIAFYASTPSYRPVMALHGWQEQAESLSNLASRGKWQDMPKLVDDEMLETFAVTAVAADLPETLHRRYHNLANRLNLYLPFIPGERDSFWRFLVTEFSN